METIIRALDVGNNSQASQRETMIFPIRIHSASAIAATLGTFLDETLIEGIVTIVAEGESNSILASGTAEQLTVVKSLVERREPREDDLAASPGGGAGTRHWTIRIFWLAQVDGAAGSALDGAGIPAALLPAAQRVVQALSSSLKSTQLLARPVIVTSDNVPLKMQCQVAAGLLFIYSPWRSAASSSRGAMKGLS